MPINSYNSKLYLKIMKKSILLLTFCLTFTIFSVSSIAQSLLLIEINGNYVKVGDEVLAAQKVGAFINRWSFVYTPPETISVKVRINPNFVVEAVSVPYTKNDLRECYLWGLICINKGTELTFDLQANQKLEIIYSEYSIANRVSFFNF